MQFHGFLTLILIFQISLAIGQTTYYSQGSLNPRTLSSWNTNPSGGGSTPSNFNANNQIFRIQNSHNMTVNGGSNWIVSGTSSKVLIESGGTLTTASSNGFAGTLDMNSNGKFVAGGGSISGIVFGTVASDATFEYTSGSAIFNGTYPCYVLITNGSVNFNGGNQTFNSDITVNGGTLRWCSSIARTHTIGGSVIVNGSGTYQATSGSSVPTLNFTGSGKSIQISGTVTNSDHIININSGASISLATNLTTTRAFTVNSNSTFDASTYVLSGSGSFVLSNVATATLKTANTAGIASSGATGSIQTTTRTFNAGATYEYNGSTDQVTGTGLPTSLSGTLLVNNSSGVSLTNVTTTISGTLNFQSGTLLSNNNSLTLSGTVSNASSSNFVCTCTTSGPASSGGVTRTVTTSGFLFPVGPSTSSYMPATIATSSGSAPFTVRVLNLANANNASAAVQRMWNITGSGTASLTLQWNASEEGGSFDPSGALRIGRYTGGTPSWVEVSASYNAGGPSATASISAWGTNFGVGTASSLPIKLISFSATRQNNQAQLTFSTATEENNDFFAIERSGNGTDFRTIGKVNGAGTTTSIQNYTFTDETPLSGINYYRLKQVDFDGQFTYSPVVNVVFDNKAGIRLAPTPVQDQLRVELDEMFQDDAQWQLYDFAGRLVQTGVLSAENMVFNVEVGSLTPGNYVIRVVSGQTTLTKQFQK